MQRVPAPPPPLRVEWGRVTNTTQQRPRDDVHQLVRITCNPGALLRCAVRAGEVTGLDRKVPSLAFVPVPAHAEDGSG